jgi:CheY-like chemotaxis protein/HPt (histidine-containing phosphotransfer) domain-containing protein
LSELRKKTYTHVFVSSFLYDSSKRIVTRLELTDVVLVLLCEYSENTGATSGARSIAMPAHAGMIADILNGAVQSSHYNESETNKTVPFIAPDAGILIVDDVKTNLLVTKGLLAPFRMNVDCAASGKEAIELVKSNRYDLVLMDHMMPEMDGIEATAEIRALGAQDDYFVNLPIIALSANAVFGVRDMFLQNGMNDYLPKPIYVAKLYGALERWIPNEKQQKYIEKTVVAEKPDIEIEGVDTRVGFVMTGGNSENYKRVLETFYSDSIDKKTQIEDALKKENPSLFTTYVHALKSASASIGALELSEEAKLLEIAGHCEDTEYIADNIEPFLQHLSDTADAIANALSRVGDLRAAGAEEAGQGSRELLLTLKTALAEINVEETDKALTSLRSKNLTAGARKELAEINRLILLFEYDEAMEIIDAMLRRPADVSVPVREVM